MNCRFLKNRASSIPQKCDGVKPVWGPCRKHPKDDGCESSDGPARSRTEALEGTVQRLEHELEHQSVVYQVPPDEARLEVLHLLNTTERVSERPMKNSPIIELYYHTTIPSQETPL
ncbi:hypothetical protein C8R46DRAFT_1211116 [Mycena filopes]|nr:hypothetical protein C8R46DRAFT_1211116 [Mycena filopes]